MNEAQPGIIGAKLIEAKIKMKPLGKDDWNPGQKFHFRGIDALYDMLHPILKEVGLVTLPSVKSVESAVRVTKNGTPMNYVLVVMEYTVVAEDGSSIKGAAVGEALDAGDKAANKAMSNAHKYFLFQLFGIPTGDVEADHEENEGVPEMPPRSKQGQQTQRQNTTHGKRPADEDTPWNTGTASNPDPAVLDDGTVLSKLGQRCGLVAATPEGKEVLRGYHKQVGALVQSNQLDPKSGTAALAIIKARANEIDKTVSAGGSV